MGKALDEVDRGFLTRVKPVKIVRFDTLRKAAIFFYDAYHFKSAAYNLIVLDMCDLILR